jgi:hypothetical protein
MSNFNFDQAEVVEMNTNELAELEGGGIIGLVLCIAGAICNYFGV